MAQIMSLSLNGIYEQNPLVVVNKIKDEITGYDNEALVTENAMMNYIDNILTASRYVSLQQIQCLFPVPAPNQIVLEYVSQCKQWMFVWYDIARRNNKIDMDCGQRNYLRCILKYLTKWFMIDLKNGSLEQYSHLVPSYTPEIFYDGCVKINPTRRFCR